MDKSSQAKLKWIQGGWLLPILSLLPSVTLATSRSVSKRFHSLRLRTFAEAVSGLRASDPVMRVGGAFQLGALGTLGLETRRQAGGRESHSLRWSRAAPIKGGSIQVFCQFDQTRSLFQALQVRGTCGGVLPQLGLFAAVGRPMGDSSRRTGWGYWLAWSPLAAAGARDGAFQSWRRVGGYMTARAETVLATTQGPASETGIGTGGSKQAFSADVQAAVQKLVDELEDWYKANEECIEVLRREISPNSDENAKNKFLSLLGELEALKRRYEEFGLIEAETTAPSDHLKVQGLRAKLSAFENAYRKLFERFELREQYVRKHKKALLILNESQEGELETATVLEGISRESEELRLQEETSMAELKSTMDAIKSELGTLAGFANDASGVEAETLEARRLADELADELEDWYEVIDKAYKALNEEYNAVVKEYSALIEETVAVDEVYSAIDEENKGLYCSFNLFGKKPFEFLQKKNGDSVRKDVATLIDCCTILTPQQKQQLIERIDALSAALEQFDCASKEFLIQLGKAEGLKQRCKGVVHEVFRLNEAEAGIGGDHPKVKGLHMKLAAFDAVYKNLSRAGVSEDEMCELKQALALFCELLARQEVLGIYHLSRGLESIFEPINKVLITKFIEEKPFLQSQQASVMAELKQVTDALKSELQATTGSGDASSSRPRSGARDAAPNRATADSGDASSSRPMNGARGAAPNRATADSGDASSSRPRSGAIDAAPNRATAGSGDASSSRPMNGARGAAPNRATAGSGDASSSRPMNGARGAAPNRATADSGDASSSRPRSGAIDAAPNRATAGSGDASFSRPMNGAIDAAPNRATAGSGDASFSRPMNGARDAAPNRPTTNLRDLPSNRAASSSRNLESRRSWVIVTCVGIAAAVLIAVYVGICQRRKGKGSAPVSPGKPLPKLSRPKVGKETAGLRVGLGPTRGA